MNEINQIKEQQFRKKHTLRKQNSQFRQSVSSIWYSTPLKFHIAQQKVVILLFLEMTEQMKASDAAGILPKIN